MHSDNAKKEKTILPLQQQKKGKNVTVSLRIGNDGNSLPLFIGKNGKNLKFIQRQSGIAAVHTSWLIGEEEERLPHSECKHDSITLKGTQAQIENALRASTVILERVGKWYDKRKLSLLCAALKETNGIEHDLETLDVGTLESALLSIPDIDRRKLLSTETATIGKKRLLSLIFFGEEKKEKKMRLIDFVFNYCANKQGKVFLLNLCANFYCNVPPMIELRECLPFIPAAQQAD